MAWTKMWRDPMRLWQCRASQPMSRPAILRRTSGFQFPNFRPRRGSSSTELWALTLAEFSFIYVFIYLVYLLMFSRFFLSWILLCYKKCLYFFAYFYCLLWAELWYTWVLILRSATACWKSLHAEMVNRRFTHVYAMKVVFHVEFFFPAPFQPKCTI